VKLFAVVNNKDKTMKLDNSLSKNEKWDLLRNELVSITKNYQTSQSINSKISHASMYINKKKIKIKNVILIMTSFLDSHSNNISLSERFYYIQNNIKSVVLCKNCQKKKPVFQSLTTGYREFCSAKCSNSFDEKKSKAVNTNLKKYGHINPMRNKNIKEKLKKTNLERFGVTAPAKNHKIMEKIKNTNLKKYGTEQYFQSDRHKEKRKQVLLTNFDKLINSEKFKDKYMPLFTKNEYKGVVGHKYWIQCLTCQTKFKFDLNKGRYPKCPTCFPSSRSKGEHEIFEFLINYIDHIQINTREITDSNSEFDLFLPNHKLAIEYNGLFWHSELYLKRNQNYHINKSLKCFKKKIKLIHIFEDEWQNKQDIVKDLLIRNINKLPYSINSKDCEIKKVNNNESIEFLNTHHIKGFDNSIKDSFGLYCDNYLTSIMSFDGHNLLRYCEYTGVKIVNSFETLLNYAIQKLKTSKIAVNIDLRFENGKNYKKHGFEYVEYIEPQYYYLKHGTICRYSFEELKESLIIENKLTEWENLQENGYDRIWDCGYVLYELNLK